MKPLKSLTLTLAVLIVTIPVFSCTTAILSGKHTPDGRPVMWKHRDTGHLDNKLMYFADGRYNYIGLINSEDTEGSQVWAGTNSAGFAIMNAALYDVNLENPTDYRDREGYVMKQALQQCATLEDFEAMLREMDKPIGVASTFGVIDAQGGAAYYEVDNQDFVKYDVNDNKMAPHGYIIRSNFSYRGRKDQGYGYIRYQNALHHINQADATGSLNYKTFIRDLSRSTYHSLLEKDYKEIALNSTRNPHFLHAADLIVRNSSASAVVFKGVKKGESPDMTTMWTLLGYPYTTVACPVWVKGGDRLPEILTGSNDGKAPLCNMAMELKKQAYPIQRGSGSKYLNIAALFNDQNTGITQKIRPVEEEIIQTTEKKMHSWRRKGITRKGIEEHYQWLNNHLSMQYERLFGL